MPKIITILLIVIVIAIVLLLLAALITGNRIFKLLLLPGSDKKDLEEADHNEVVIFEPAQEELDAWLPKQTPKDVWITSHDNLRLHSSIYSAEKPSNKWVIGHHGYMDEGASLIGLPLRFQKWDYHTLLLDARALGQSEGEYIGLGWLDRLDVMSWIDWILEQDPDAEIVLFGISMGGAAVMMASGEDLPPNVRVIIEDCGFTSAWEEFSYQVKEIFKVPTFPIMNFCSMFAKIHAGYSFKEASAENQVKKSKIPTLFIHGEDDTFVPVDMAKRLYNAAKVEKDLIIVPHAGHGQAAQVLNEEYWHRIKQFIDRFID